MCSCPRHNDSMSAELCICWCNNHDDFPKNMGVLRNNYKDLNSLYLDTRNKLDRMTNNMDKINSCLADFKKYLDGIKI
jgi:hypothetical protein